MTTYKRYLLSSAITFFSAFALVVIRSWEPVSYSQAAIFSLLAVGVRAGFKALGEWLTGQTADAPSTLDIGA